MLRIDGSKVARGLALLYHLCHFVEYRDKILLGNPRHLWRVAVGRPHHFALRDPGIQGMLGNVIKVRARVSQEFFPGRQILRQRFFDGEL